MRRPKIDIATWQQHKQQRRTRKSRNCLTIIEWRGAVLQLPRRTSCCPCNTPPPLALSIIPFNSRCPDSCFKCFVSGSLVFLAYEKEKCRLGDVFMVNDLCLAARSVKVIEWEMLSAAGAGRGKGATKCLGQCAAAAGRHVSQIQPCC